MSPLLLLFLLLLLLSYPLPTHSSKTLSILLDLKSSLHISHKTPQFSSWTSSTPPCNFSAVTCSPSGDDVVSIDLSSSGLTGTIPFSSLCSLPSLSHLSLHSNHLSGTLTSDLLTCLRLRHLDLHSNSLSGTLPDLSPLTSLRYLNLAGNAFIGAIPSLPLVNLTHLLLGDNPFDSTPFPSSVLSLPHLTYLYLSNCTLHGPIPRGIGNLTRLVNLELADNALTGKIPLEIVKLSKLSQLELYGNSLSGTLPTGLGNLSRLEFFDASRNKLVGGLEETAGLRNLISFQLYKNNFSGELPAAFGEFPKLVNLSLYENRLTGEIPGSLGSHSEFYFIDVSTNRFTGPIPPKMCARGTMRMLLMLENQFTGGIPSTYAGCRTLVRFRVSDNQLNGEVPGGIWSLPKLEILDLARNQFIGGIGEGVGEAEELRQVLLAENQFTGPIPDGIGQAGKEGIVTVDLSDNGFFGGIPPALGRLRALNSLRLRSNALSGPIPREIGSCVGLNELDLSANRLTGGVPEELGRLPVLNSLNLSNNRLDGKVPVELSLLRLSSLDMSNNRLEGELPSGLVGPAYEEAFRGNKGLCSNYAGGVRARCGSGKGSGGVHVAVACGVVGLVGLGVGVWVVARWGRKVGEEKGAWSVRWYRVLEMKEREVVEGVREENVIGKGGSGFVYRVKLGSGSTVAVKHVGKGPVEEQLGAEVDALSKIRHANVIKLYCSMTSEVGSLLIYEYLPNGSLWEKLHGGGKEMEWECKYEVALGAAKGLEYLHHGWGRSIVHGDVKSGNILLDEEFGARIADFGLARELDGDGESTKPFAGTHGYICPEYAYTSKVTEKSDVYSFGVVLMEIVTGKRPLEPEFGENKDIVHWISTKITSIENVLSLLDPRIPKKFHQEAINVLKVSIQCTVNLPSLRPSMRTVVQMLEDVRRQRIRMCHVDEIDFDKVFKPQK